MSESRPPIPPPPTKYGPATAQPKEAEPLQPKEAEPPQPALAPPLTRYGPVTALVQAKPAPGPFIPLAVLQPMMGKEEEEDTIGKRVGRRNKGNSFKSKRMKNKYGGGSGKMVPRYYAPYRSKGIWNGKRPAWDEGTWLLLASNATVIPYRYTCVQCGKGPIYRKKDMPGQNRADDATIDHKTDWWNYITSHARPNPDGSISPLAAKNAYNDTKNLQIMCRSCNAKKNGPKNVHD